VRSPVSLSVVNAFDLALVMSNGQKKLPVLLLEPITFPFPKCERVSFVSICNPRCREER
jgi:hypothetical protein